MTNNERNPNVEPRNLTLRGCSHFRRGFGSYSGFGTRISDFFRHSSFIIRISAAIHLFALLAWILSVSASPGADFRLATFSADVTVPIGHGMMGGSWLSKKIADPLEAHGLALLGGGKPIVIVAVDWCEIRNQAYARWQEALANAAGTTPERVMVCTVHQHDAPVADLEAERILRDRKLEGTVCDLEFHEVAVQRVAKALRESLANARGVTHIGIGEAQVERVASNRRYLAPDGTVRFDRMSRTTDKIPAEAPEGLTDPWLKTLSFWSNDVPFAAISAYATHPMSYYGAGEVSADFPGLARRQRQRDTPGVEQIYVTGAAGNLTAGKYNNGARETRGILADRLYQAMAEAWRAMRTFPLTNMVGRFEPVQFEPRSEPGFTTEDLNKKLTPGTAPFQQCLAAMGLSWRKRLEAGPPITISSLDFGAAQWLLLPGEAYIEFQLAAQRLRPDSFVMVAGYGDGATGYIPTERHRAERDSNLGDWCWVAPGSEQRLLEAIRKTLPVPEGETTAAPWKSNFPIVLAKKELYLKHPAPRVAPWASLSYVGPRLELREVQGIERESDVGEKIQARWSADNGRTWSEFRPVQPSNKIHYKGVSVWEGECAGTYHDTSDLQVQLWLRQIDIKGVYHNFTYLRTSRDQGRSWSDPKQLRYEAGDAFDPEDPLKASFLNHNEGYAGNNILVRSNGTLVLCLAHANAPGDPKNNSRPWRMGSICFIGKWNPGAPASLSANSGKTASPAGMPALPGEFEWKPGARVEISPEQSARGLMEPEIAELKDGRLLVVWRGSTDGWDGTKAKAPGRKLYALSSDGGRTITPPAEWAYDDGSNFYSPSSFHRMIRHSVTGKLYWLGNISATPPSGNSPRYPLVIAEVDEAKAAIKRNTVTAIDDRQPGQGDIQFSNFPLVEDRVSHDLILNLTTFGQEADPKDWATAENFRYTLTLR